ncbi:7447_t:CDS:2, partial [Entrophospora sp. SA101]
NKIMTTESESSGGIVRIIKDLASGTVGGICQVLVGQRLQTQPTPKLGEQPRFTGMLDCVQKTKKNEGFRAFYKGTTTPLVGVGACVSIQFGALEFMKRFFNERNGYTGGLTSPQLYLAGAIAGIANSVVSGPVEHIRTRLQVQITSTTDIKPSSKAVSTKIYSGPIDCIRQIYSSYGMKGIYKGQTITMIREFQGYGAYFLVYEYLFQKAMSREQKKRSEIESWKSCLYGAAAGYGMWLSVYPVDVIKSKIQTDGFSGEERQYKGIIDCARKTFRKEGINGFLNVPIKEDLKCQSYYSMRSGRLKPNKETYLRILNICSANSSKQPETTYELATDVWNKLVKHDDQQSKEANDAVIVDNELVSGVISVFKDTKHPHHAFDIIDNTYGFGKVSTPSAEDKESSESTKEDLSTSTIASNKPALILPITNDVLVSIFGLCFKVRQYNLGIEYYNQVMTKYPNFSLDINAYNSVITLYNLTYQYKKTLEAYHSQFKKGGMVQNTTTFEYLMTACQSLRDLSTAKEVLENAVENQVMLKTFGLTRLFRLILEQARTTENYNDICWLLEKIDKTVDIDFDKEKKGFILIKYMDDAIFLRTLSSAYEIALEEVKDLSEEKRVQWIEDKKYFDHKADRLLETTSKYSKQNSMHEDDLRMRKIYQGRWKTQDDESWYNPDRHIKNQFPLAPPHLNRRYNNYSHYNNFP